MTKLFAKIEEMMMNYVDSDDESSETALWFSECAFRSETVSLVNECIPDIDLFLSLTN